MEPRDGNLQGSLLAGVREYWTDSRQSLVLVGSPRLIEALANRLDQPDSAIVDLSHSQSAIGLWGDDLTAYLHGFRSFCIADADPEFRYETIYGVGSDH